MYKSKIIDKLQNEAGQKYPVIRYLHDPRLLLMYFLAGRESTSELQIP